MGRIVVVVGSPLLEYHPKLKAWAYTRLHDLLNAEGRETLVLGRLATPIELWAHEQARHSGFHVVDYRLDGVRWSSRVSEDEWCRGGEATLYEASAMVANVVAYHLAEGWTAQVWRFDVQGYELVDPLWPLIERLNMDMRAESTPSPPGFFGFDMASE